MLDKIVQLFPVDSYDLKARYAPALLLSFPVLVTCWTSFNSEVKEISSLVGGLLSIALIYGLSIFVRGMGKRLEPKLKKQWGGFPSTLIVSLEDSTLGYHLKRQYIEAAGNFVQLPIPSEEEQAKNPSKSSELIEQLFFKIKGVIRENDSKGLWSLANAEYGFVRNLYGSRWVWLFLSFASCVGSGFSLYLHFEKLVLIGLIFNILYLSGCVILGWLILPGLTKEIGFRYAEHAWESFYNIAQKKGEKKKGDKHG